ncbi:hypothetical protein PISMIDRAFT_478526 [Pisolithus microcarpus 441]|uniref:Uncharacterized protein n=1 Tax=Pisolithus microcarpus 441 TaxID=765257 RepID=A0A0C9YUS7_9AGAM|nr:hypothetical protein PISMIDRAFT_478526 [Pisolithus microcarpus 441]
MFPALIFPLILSGTQQLQSWAGNRRTPRHARQHNGAGGTTSAMAGHLDSEQAVSGEPFSDDIEVSLRYNERLRSSEERSGFDPAADERI